MKILEEIDYKIKTPEEKVSENMLPYLTIPVTDVCNRRCLFCGEGGELTAKGQDKYFNIDTLVDRALSAIKRGIHKFRLTGGEPSLHPEIGSILKFFSDQKTYLLLNTNGSRIMQHQHDFTELNDNVHVAVSLHTPNEEAYNQIMQTCGQIGIVKKGIEFLASIGNLLRLNMVVTRYNQGHIDDMISYCKDLGCGLKIHEIVDVPTPFIKRDNILVPIQPIEEELARRASEILPHEYSEGFGIPCRRYVVDNVTINVKSLGRGSRYDTEGLCKDCSHMLCHEGLYDCYVLPNGNILPCRWGKPFTSETPFSEQLEKAIEIFQRARYVSHIPNNE
jgi:molybdenum cofactor biosynthesis enzyme MoaA